MRGSLIGHLISKYWRLHRALVSLSIAGGIVALVVMQFGNETTILLGSVWFFICLIILGSMLPFSVIVNERKKQNLAFLMSLPVSSFEYTIAKILSSLSIFLAPWLTLLIAAILLIEIRGVIPHGAIPTLVILAILPFIGLCLILAAALVSESESWGIAASVVCNSSYWFVWYLLSRISSLRANWNGRVTVWNSTVLTILFSEIGLIALLVGLTFFFQSRKRDFI